MGKLKEEYKYFNKLAKQAEKLERDNYRKFMDSASDSFDYCWFNELSGIRLNKNEDYYEFAKRIAKMAYIKGVEDAHE